MAHPTLVLPGGERADPHERFALENGTVVYRCCLGRWVVQRPGLDPSGIDETEAVRLFVADHGFDVGDVLALDSVILARVLGEAAREGELRDERVI
jgi:hypothetical protein